MSHNSPLKVVVNDENQQRKANVSKLDGVGGLKGGNELFLGV